MQRKLVSRTRRDETRRDETRRDETTLRDMFRTKRIGETISEWFGGERHERARARNPAPQAGRCEPCTSAVDSRALSVLRAQTHARDGSRAPPFRNSAAHSDPRTCNGPRRAAKQPAGSPPAHGDRAPERPRRRSRARRPSVCSAEPSPAPTRIPRTRPQSSPALVGIHPAHPPPAPARIPRTRRHRPALATPARIHRTRLFASRPLAACRRFLKCSTNAVIASS